MSIKMGDTVTDLITGYSGVVTGQCEYITGCTQILVQPPVKDGVWQESKWIDIDRLEVNSKVDRLEFAVQTAGFDRPAPMK